jgi:hypothetical protein
MKKDLKKFNPSLTIPGFDIKLENEHSCKLTSRDGRNEVAATIDESNRKIIISGPMFPKPLEEEISYLRCPDDVITNVAKALTLVTALPASEGFSARIDGNELVFSQVAKPGYSLRMTLPQGKLIFCGQAYENEVNAGWNTGGAKFFHLSQDLEKLIPELKAYILNLGEPVAGPNEIANWATQKLEKLLPQGFTFTPRPEAASVEFSHPVGLSGAFSFSIFPNKQKMILFSCNHPNYQKPYRKEWLENEANDIIYAMRGALALALVHQGVGKEWKSTILKPELSFTSLQVVNTKLTGWQANVLQFCVERERMCMTGNDDHEPKWRYYPISDIPTVINVKKPIRLILERAERINNTFVKETKKNNFLQAYAELASRLPDISAKVVEKTTQHLGQYTICKVVEVQCDITKTKINVIPTPTGQHKYYPGVIPHESVGAVTALLEKVASIDIAPIKDREHLPPPMLVKEIEF